MYLENEYREYCRRQNVAGKALEAAVQAVRGLECVAKGPDGTLASSDPQKVKRYIASLVARGPVDRERLTAFIRYFSLLRFDSLTIWLQSLELPIGVLPAVSRRLAALEGEEISRRIFHGIEIPPPGSPPEAYTPVTAILVSRLEAALPPERCRLVLTGNVHNVPAEAFASEREYYRKAASIDEWLADRHARLVATLERHRDDGTLWYEQKITGAVVEFVRADQKIVTGRRAGDRIFVTGIPYDPDRYLASRDHLERRRSACHCPLVRSSISAGKPRIPTVWCNCSAGYAKLPFDAVFGRETRAEVLETVLGGADRCRYAIHVP